MSDTPRTDTHMIRCACGSYVIETDFARGLEREIQAERDALTTLAKDTLRLRGEMDDLRLENAKLAALPDSEAWDDYNAIKTLQRENAALRQHLVQLGYIITYFNGDIAIAHDPWHKGKEAKP